MVKKKANQQTTPKELELWTGLEGKVKFEHILKPDEDYGDKYKLTLVIDPDESENNSKFIDEIESLTLKTKEYYEKEGLSCDILASPIKKIGKQTRITLHTNSVKKVDGEYIKIKPIIILNDVKFNYSESPEEYENLLDMFKENILEDIQKKKPNAKLDDVKFIFANKDVYCGVTLIGYRMNIHEDKWRYGVSARLAYISIKDDSFDVKESNGTKDEE